MTNCTCDGTNLSVFPVGYIIKAGSILYDRGDELIIMILEDVKIRYDEMGKYIRLLDSKTINFRYENTMGFIFPAASLYEKIA
jgi:hypothetical protein